MRLMETENQKLFIKIMHQQVSNARKISIRNAYDDKSHWRTVIERVKENENINGMRDLTYGSRLNAFEIL